MTRALVVGGVAYGETHRVVRLLTPDGRIDAFAPGVRNSRRRFAGALDALQTIDAQLHRRTREDGLRTLEAATVLEARLDLREDLERIALGSYGAELCWMLAPSGAQSGLFERAEELLNGLKTLAASRPLRRAFELRLLAELGYATDLRVCVACGTLAAEVGRLDFGEGGRLCRRHGAPAGVRWVGPRSFAWAASILEAEALSCEHGLDADGQARAEANIGPPLDLFFDQLLERRPKSAELLRSLNL
ncbi:MAG: DNA repair protein RecO [Myxococcota bacterium]